MSDVVIMISAAADVAAVQPAYDHLKQLGVSVGMRLASAHASPALVQETVGQAEDDGAKVFICADGGAAHLAGAVAAQSIKPVIGLPLANSALGGVDALYSTVSMPAGVPVATVAVGGAINAAVLAAQILALQHEGLSEQLSDQREQLGSAMISADDELQASLRPSATTAEPAPVGDEPSE